MCLDLSASQIITLVSYPAGWALRASVDAEASLGANLRELAAVVKLQCTAACSAQIPQTRVQ